MWKTIRKNYRRLIASLLTMAMVVTNAGGNLGTIFAAGETENALFLVEGEDLKEAIREAREQGEVFDFSELRLAAKRKSIKTRYEKLLGKKEGAVYALNLEIDDSYAPEGTELQVFYNAGTEDVIFLFLNGSDMVVDYRVNIDGYETEPVRVNPNTANIEADGEEAPSYAENYEAADMIDDEAKKLGAEVLNPEETTGAAEEEPGTVEEESKDDPSTEETGDAATEESSETLDASEESKEDDNSVETEGTESSEEADGNGEAEEGTPEDEGETEAETESVEEKEDDTETEAETEAEEETEAEDEASEEAGAEDGELLSISRHEAAIVAVSVEELEDGDAEVAEETEASEEETEEETEAETEAETEEETEAETESEGKADETEADAEEKEEESEAGAETGNVPEEGAAGAETEGKPEESEAGAETESKPEAGETGTENGEDIIIEETGKDDSAEIPEDEDSSAADIPDSDGSGKGDQIEMDGQLLEDDNVEILGELKGKEYDTVTVLDHVNARAWKIALEDIEAIIVSEAMDYVVEYEVNYPDGATVKGADSVAEGENLYFAVEPEEGFEIVGVYANGSEAEEVEDIADLASASNWKGYSHVYVVEGVEEDLWVNVEVEELAKVIAAATYTAETGDAVFSVDVPDGAFKEKVKLRVTKIEGEAELKELVKQANDALKDGQAIAEAEAYDIAFISLESGEEIEPLKPVAVDMSFKEAIASDKNEAAEAEKEIVVVHLPDDAEAKTVASAENADTTEFSFQADSFSLYMRALVMKPRVTVGETGYPTIAMAVAKAADGDTITLLDDFTESVTISKNVTFDLNEHTWRGADNETALTISAGNVEVKNGTMSSAVEKCKAIEAKAGILTLRDVKFTGPITALYLNASSGSLKAELTGCTFNENIRAIYASKTKLTLNECEIIKNNSRSNGAIVYLSNSETTVNEGEIRDNIGVGTAIIDVSNGSFVMDGTTLTNNSGSGVVRGGAKITLKKVVATDNIGTSSMYSGGSVLNANSIKNKTVILENVVATGNENTAEHGGAFYFYGSDSNTSIEIKGCTITDNTAKKRGGAIYLDNKGTTIIHDTVITRNTANDKVIKTMGYGWIGGGLYVASTEGSVTLSGKTRIYNNYTPGDNKLVPGTNTHGSADVVLSSTKVTSYDSAKDPNNFTRASLKLNMENPFIDEDGNQHTLTQFDRRKINENGYYYTGSGYYWPMGYYTSTEEPARVYLNGNHNGEKDIQADNLAEAVQAAQDNNIDKIYVCGNTTIDMASAVSLNSGVTFVRCMDHPNGHMFTINGDVTLDKAHIDGQNVAGNESLIYVPVSGHLTIAGDTVIENGKNAATKGKGGAIHVSQGRLTMSGGEIRNNTAREGGGIYAMGGGSKAIVFEGGTVSKNTATGGNGGGGAYIEATSSEFGVQGGRTLFDSNVSAQLGGGVFLVNGVNANTHHYIYKATFTNNQSNRSGYYFDGGAIYIQSGTTAHMKNVYVSGNSDGDGEFANNNYTAVAVCPSGEVAIYELEGLLSINNGKNPDIGIIKAGTIAPTAADPKVYLPSNAPGGGEVRYTYSKGGDVLDISDHQFIEGYFKVYTEASDSTIAAARETAERDGVIITSNYARQYGSGIMTNGILKIGTETKSLKVVKKWADAVDKNHDNDQILVYLTKDGKIVDKDFRSDSSVILNKGNNWSYTWTNLGNEFEWGVKEASVHGYTSKVDIKKDTQFSAIADKYYIATITNEPSGELSDKLVITKTAHGLDPDASYKFTLKLDNVGDKMFALQMDGTLYPIYNNEIEFYLKSGQSAVVDGLPEGFTYEVEEEEGDYYTYKSDIVTANETGNIFEVSRVNVSKTEISGSKEWDDDGNRDGVRPESIHVTLTASNGLTYDQVVKADASNNWSWKFTELPEWDGNGERVIYTVSEEEVKDYSTVYPKADSRLGEYDIKNVHTPGRTSRTVEKIWNDGNDRDRVRPNSITVQLYETVDGNKKASGDAVTLNQANNWSYTWNDLFVKEDGKEIAYSVEEVNVPDKYEVQIEETGTKFIITNTYNPTVVSKTVEKRWDDHDDTDRLRPGSIQVMLLADGKRAEVAAAVVTLNAANGWKHTWEDLPANHEGNPISYTVEEVEVPNGYSVNVVNDGDVITVTNTHNPSTVKRTVNKVWNDENNRDNLRPDSISVQLIADGEVVETITLSEANNWNHQWENLPENKDGKKIVYTVKEIQVNGYTSSVNEDNGIITITNTHTPDRPNRPGGGGGNPGGGNPGGGNPGGGNPPGGPGTTTIEEPGVPLANLPPESMTELIEDSEVPLAALPRTGDSRHTKALMMMFGIAGLGMLLTAAGFRKRKDESDD